MRPTRSRTPKPPRPPSAAQPGDDGLALVLALTGQVRSDPARFRTTADLASSAGIGPDPLHDLFVLHHQRDPADWLGRERVAAAKVLLEQGDATEGEAAAAVGFDSVEALRSTFVRRTGMEPGEFGKLGERPEFVLALPPGYLRAYTLGLLGRDPLSVTERVEGGEIAKGVRLGDRPAVLRIALGEEGRARVRVESIHALAPEDVREAHGVAVRILGLAWEPEAFERRAAAEGPVARLVEGRPGLRIPQTPTVFEALVWAVVGQQVNLAFAYALRRALAEACGEDAGSGLIAHPSPRQVAALDYADLTRLRFSGRKAEYVIDTARRVASGALDLEALPRGTATEAEATLVAVRGLGRWSARYVMMRGCGFADCVPVGDAGLTLALQRFFALPERPGPAETLALMEPFAPHRTLATHHLWMTLGATA